MSLVEHDHRHSDSVKRGRKAQSPWQIPWNGWKDVLWRVFDEIEKDDTLDVAAGVAFYGLLALFPALIATISMYGLLADPEDIVWQVHLLTAAIPENARSLILQQMREISGGSTAQLRLSFLIALGVALFSASSGVAALMRGINKSYDETETRGWIRLRVVALGSTLALAAFVVSSVAMIAVLPTVLERVGLAEPARQLIEFGRWPAMAAATMLGLGILYRYAPNRTPARWQWVSPGAILATLIWTLASLSFSLYAESFGRFNKTYGTLAGVAVLALWLYLSAVAILIGAELNAELEHQTQQDSTIGPPLPMGERRATVADHLGEPRPVSDSRGFRRTVRDWLAELNRPRRSKQSAPSKRSDSA